MTKDQNKIAIRELEGLKKFLEDKETQFLQNLESNYRNGRLNACYIFLGEVCDRLDTLRNEQKFDEMLHPVFVGEIEKLKQENAELKERLEEAWSGTARRPRKNSDEEYTAHIQQEVAAAEVVNDLETKASEEKTSEEKTEATPSEVPEENKYINWNTDKLAWINCNERNILRLLELQKNNDVGTEYDDLLFQTKITDNNPSLGIIISRIGADDAIYKLNTIERLFRDHHIDSLKDLDELLNFAEITSKKKSFLLTKSVGGGNMPNGIEFDINIGMFSQTPIIETKDFSAEIKWESIIQLAKVSGLFDKQFEKDRQDKLNSNKEGGENA